MPDPYTLLALTRINQARSLLEAQPEGRCPQAGQLAALLAEALQSLGRATELDFREIGEHLYDGIYIADGTGKTLYINKAYTRITGITPEEVLGKNVEDILKEGLYKNAVTPLVIKSKRQVNSVGVSLKNNNRMLISGNPIFDESGNVKMVVVVDREITDLFSMKAELEATQQMIQAVEQDNCKNRQEIEHLRKLQFNNTLLGRSEKLQHVAKMIRQVAALDVTVLITGETGVGKEVVANAIHLDSTRKHGPFLKVNCAAIPANLLESELFGYDKGAFTGARATGKLGMFELADKGTLLLDEIGEMPLELQPKLLRIIQHQEVTRIGGARPVRFNVRLLSSTNQDLKTQVKRGTFREDLYYRLNVFPIDIPPIRERTEDIRVLAAHFVDHYNAKYGKGVSFCETAVPVLERYAWPGNVRELQNVVERLVIISEPGAVISPERVGQLLNVDPAYCDLLRQEVGLKDLVDDLERRTIASVLASCKSTRKAAQVLKVDQSTVVKKMKRLGMASCDEKSHQER